MYCAYCQAFTTPEVTQTNNEIVQKLWNLCDVLRDDGINHSDYVTERYFLRSKKNIDELDSEAGKQFSRFREQSEIPQRSAQN